MPKLKKAYSLREFGVLSDKCIIKKWLANENNVVLKNTPILEIIVNNESIPVQANADLFIISCLRSEGEELGPDDFILTSIELGRTDQIKTTNTNDLTREIPVPSEFKQVRISTTPITRNETIVDSCNTQIYQSNAISLRREQVENLNNIIEYCKNALSFQASEVLESIITNEKQKMEDEQGLWKVGGALLGLALGVGDGFDLMDVGSSFAFSNIANMAYNQVSKEQREFLRQIHSLWLVDQRSPLELRRRLGDPIGRFIGYDTDVGNSDPDENIFITNIHQNSSRGLNLQLLSPAQLAASGFENNLSVEKMREVFDSENYEILANQLYPIDGGTIPIKAMRIISKEEAEKKDPMYSYLHKSGEPYRLTFDEGEHIVYKINIPSHSDF